MVGEKSQHKPEIKIVFTIDTKKMILEPNTYHAGIF